MIIQDSVQTLVTGLLWLGALWGVLDPQDKMRAPVHSASCSGNNSDGRPRCSSQADWQQEEENAQNKGDFKESLETGKGCGF